MSNTPSISKIKKIILARNELLETTRLFFKDRNVLEVDTPLLRKYSVTDPYMNAFSVFDSKNNLTGFLQTSPEYAMKIMLSRGAGDIFQLSKMFRAEEQGEIHSPEFTMLEWYREGFDHFQLIQEVTEYIQSILGSMTINKISYENVFQSYLQIDPFKITFDDLRERAEGLLGDIPKNLLFDNYLTLLFSEIIEPQFEKEAITVIHSYPVSQASLAKVSHQQGIQTADRFEIYCGGLELANGFNELTDASEQEHRFKEDNVIRQNLQLNEIEIDIEFLVALKKGIPNCAGVALGFDRLLMLKEKVSNISDVIL
ncbi:MAG: EF-P lysine aminoacylase EpmA [Kangiellaceae bacterium]